jgi:hypothetical protein
MSIWSDTRRLTPICFKTAVGVVLRLAMVDLVRKRLTYESEIRRQFAINEMLKNYSFAFDLAARIENREERERFEISVTNQIGRFVND